MSYASSQEVRVGQRPDASDAPLYNATFVDAFTR